MGRKAIGEGEYVKNNVRVMRERLDWSQTELAEKSGLSKSHLSRIELSKQRLSLDIARILAVTMNCSVEALIGSPGGDTLFITVMAHVEAGAWAEVVERPAEDRYEVAVAENDLYPGIERMACEVHGPSMNKVFPEGSVIIGVPFMKIKEPLIPGKRYVLNRTRKDGMVEQTVKTYVRDREGKDWFYPESDDPKYQLPISYDDDTERVEVLAKVVKAIVDF